MSDLTINIIKRVSTFIRRNHLLPPPSAKGFTVVVGLSGGADSVALTHILQRLGYDLRLTHCHFGLRGEESDRDADFCAAYARRLGLPLRTVCFDTESELRLSPQSVETLCRELRYSWWEEEYRAPYDSIMDDGEKAVRLCVGHHQDDAIETMLFHLMRGTGIKGLLGIPSRNGWIARPLLCLSHQEILDYLKENRLDYVTDSTNLQNDYTRNKIRNLLLPLMEQINPNARKGIIKSICNLADTEYLASLGLNIALDEELGYIDHDGVSIRTLNRSTFDLDALTKGVLYEFLKAYMRRPEGLIPDILSAIDRNTKNRIFRTDEIYLCITEDQLLLTSAQGPGGTPFDWMPGSGHNPMSRYFSITIGDRASARLYNPDRESACFDLQKLIYPLHFRHWQKGDRIRPLGMKGYKLVSDLFSDAHLSPIEKEQAWVVTDATGRIAWVSGLRMSEEFRVEPFTHRVLHIRHTADPSPSCP